VEIGELELGRLPQFEFVSSPRFSTSALASPSKVFEIWASDIDFMVERVPAGCSTSPAPSGHRPGTGSAARAGVEHCQQYPGLRFARMGESRRSSAPDRAGLVASGPDRAGRGRATSGSCSALGRPAQAIPTSRACGSAVTIIDGGSSDDPPRARPAPATHRPPHGGNLFRQKVPPPSMSSTGSQGGGSTQVQELGSIETPIALTSTLSIGARSRAWSGTRSRSTWTSAARPQRQQSSPSAATPAQRHPRLVVRPGHVTEAIAAAADGR
jgi:hypothetical protein